MEQQVKIPWSRPSIGEEEKKAVQRVMDSGWLSQGPETEAFERELADYLDVKHVVCLNSGTSALLCGLLALNPKKVAVPSYTFPATWNTVIMCGKVPRFGDVEVSTFLMKVPPKYEKKAEDEDEEEDKELLIPTSIAGHPLNPEDWKDRWVMEDGCEALGAETREGKTGSHWTTCFSFHSAKLLTTVEGGAVATNDDMVDYQCRLIRNHGESPIRKYEYMRLGLNLRTTDVASAIGRVQLRKLSSHLTNRAKIAQLYRQELRDRVGFQEMQPYVKVHANMFMPVLVEDPVDLEITLRMAGVETRRPWPPYSEFEDANAIYGRVLAIPIYNDMTDEEAMVVVEAIKG